MEHGNRAWRYPIRPGADDDPARAAFVEQAEARLRAESAGLRRRGGHRGRRGRRAHDGVRPRPAGCRGPRGPTKHAAAEGDAAGLSALRGRPDPPAPLGACQVISSGNRTAAPWVTKEVTERGVSLRTESGLVSLRRRVLSNSF